MAGFVPDASATLPWCLDDEATVWSGQLLDRLRAGEPAVVPAHWPAEVANGLLMAVRRGRLSAGKRQRFIEDLCSLPIQVDPFSTAEAFASALDLAETHKLTLYDAAYLALAQQFSLPLASLDGDLKRAARNLGVPLVEAS